MNQNRDHVSQPASNSDMNTEMLRVELMNARRQLDVEAALERVRVRAMTTQSSDEGQAVVTVLFTELEKLGFDISHCSSWLFDKEELLAYVWMPNSLTSGLPECYTLPYRDHPVLHAFLNAWTDQQQEWVYEISSELKDSWHEILFSETGLALLPGHIKESMRARAQIVISATFTKFGALQSVDSKPLDKKDFEILERFGRVLDLAYARFDDLRNAEERTREAQTEVALERIRGQALAMRESNDLLDIVVTMHAEFSRLGFHPGYFWHMRWTPTTYEKAMTSGDGTRIGMVMDLPRGFHEVQAMTDWEQVDDPIGVFQFDADGAVDYVNRMVETGDFHIVDPNAPSEDDIRHIGGITFVMARTTHGEIGYSLPGVMDPIPEELDVLERFARGFDLAYRRFEDLKKAEAQAREAQIELALERVRNQTMAMQRSSELADIVGKIFAELTQLDFVLTRCIIWIFDEEKNASWWMANPEIESGAESFHIPYNEYPVFQAHLRAWQQREPVMLYTLSGNAKVEFDDFLFADSGLANLPEVAQEGMREPEEVYLSNSANEFGSLMVSGLEPLSIANLDIVQRFGRVFQQSYTRFIDVQQAEEQAREAQIEAALETVRSRSLAMHASDELGDVVVVIVEKLKDLGVVLDANGVILCTYFPDSRDVLHWIAAPDFSFAGSYLLPYFEHPIFSEAWQSKESGAEYFSQAYSKEEKDSFFEHAFEHSDYRKFPDEFKEWVFQNDQHILSFAWQTNSAILIPSHTGITPSEADAAILKRFVNVFEQSYVRFLDLKKAEAAARESRIETALERVRAHAMGMQKPDDISDVSILMFDEMEALGIESLRSGISIPLEDERYEFHAATKQDDGSTTLVLGNESVNVHPIIRRAYDGWQNQEQHQVAILEGGDLVQYYHAVFDTMPLPDWQDRMKTGAEARECFATFPFADGWLYTFMRRDITDEAVDIHVRFARAFGLAYQRYHDLKKAEQDYAALLEEKARTEKALTDLKATQKQLVEQEKLASLGSLTAGIAHEIKNPLNFVNNFAEVSTELVEELSEAIATGDADEAQSILKEISDNAAQIAKHGKRADSIVKAMMQHARGGSSDPEMVNLNEFLEEYINLSWHGMRARDHGFQAEVVRRFDETVGEVQVQPQEMGRVILNLLNNAFDALKGTDPAQVTVTTKQANGSVGITVSDNGSGIPEEIREKIFEPFFTTKATGEGTGLGLSLSYDIVTKGHNGHMSVGVSPEGGAEFRISLPT